MYKINLGYIPQFNRYPTNNQWKLAKKIHQVATLKTPRQFLDQRDWKSFKFQFPEPDWQDLAQWQALLKSQYLFNQEEVWDLNHSVLPCGLDPNPQAVIPSGIISTQHLCLASQAMYVMMKTAEDDDDEDDEDHSPMD